jgi:Putative adhesin
MQTFDTPAPITLSLELGVGDVQIDASNRTDTTVEVRPSDPRKKADVAAAQQTRVDFSNGLLVIQAPKGSWRQRLAWRGGESVDVRIGLPMRSDVRADAGVASLRTTGRLGEVRAKTGVGDVRLDEVGPLELKTGAGDVSVDRAIGRVTIACGSGGVRIGAIDGPASVKNGNGDTWIGELTGEVRVNAANGAITIDRASAGVVAKTANGDVRIGDVARGAIVAQSAFGALEVGVRDGAAVWLDLDTKFGTVESELDASSSPGADDEVVEVHAHTSYGNISVHRALATADGRDGS